MAHGRIDLHQHSIISCPDYLRKMRSGNETKHSTQQGQARPPPPPKKKMFGGVYVPLHPPPVVPPLLPLSWTLYILHHLNSPLRNFKHLAMFHVSK